MIILGEVWDEYYGLGDTHDEWNPFAEAEADTDEDLTRYDNCEED